MFGSVGLRVTVDFRRITGGESRRCLSPMRGGVHMVLFDLFGSVVAHVLGDLMVLAIISALRKICERNAERKKNDAPPTKEEHR